MSHIVLSMRHLSCQISLYDISKGAFSQHLTYLEELMEVKVHGLGP